MLCTMKAAVAVIILIWCQSVFCVPQDDVTQVSPRRGKTFPTKLDILNHRNAQGLGNKKILI